MEQPGPALTPKQALPQHLASWRNEVADPIVAHYANAGQVIQPIRTEAPFLPRTESHALRKGYRDQNAGGGGGSYHTFSTPRVDCTHWALDAAVFLDHVRHVLSAVVAAGPGAAS